MKLSIIGYGKMGKAVEQIATDRGHAVQVVASSQNPPISKDADCAIEFSHASIAPLIIRTHIDAAIPIVSGTTGWDAEIAEVKGYCHVHQGTLLWSPNFSIGMQIVFELNQKLAALMNHRPEYQVSVLEAHHTEKKDKPSGTAISIAKQIIGELDRKSYWELKEDQILPESALEVISERIPDVKGIHRITYAGPYDVISLRHKALSRDAFAFGAVLSAEWLYNSGKSGRTGVYSFSHVLKDLA